MTKETDRPGMLLERLSAPVLLVSRTGELEYANASARKLVGPAGDGAAPAWLSPELGSLLRGEAEEVEVEKRIESPAGPRDFVVRLERLGGDGGEPDAVMVHLRDTTELRAARAELDSFAYSVSHDLRSPLRAIDGFSRILEERPESRLDDEGRRLLEVVRQNARRMGRQIEALLRFSRTGRKELGHGPVPMAVLVASAWQAAVPAAERERSELVANELPDAWGDAELLRQVVLELISNAVKFSAREPQRRVSVTSLDRDGGTEYAVADNGVGFEMAYAGKLFGVFQRLHGESEFEGIGIGLAIVRRIVSKHGGTVSVESVPGDGAVFRFWLPGHSREPAAPAGPSSGTGLRERGGVPIVRP